MFLFCFTFFIVNFIYKFSVETNKPKFFLVFFALLEATLLTLFPIFFCVIVVAITFYSTTKVVAEYKTNVVDFYQKVSYSGNRNEMDFYVVFINNENKKQHLCVERTYNIGDEITIVEKMDWFEDKT
jgi:hypothetical protein